MVIEFFSPLKDRASIL